MPQQSYRAKAENLRADVHEAMLLPVGERITIHNAQNKRVEGKIAGFEHGHYIMVRIQGLIGADVQISAGEKINAHFIRNDFTVAFVSTLIAKFSFESFHFLACQYPQRFVTSTKRLGSRVDCMLPVTVKSDERLALGVITNVSFKGCQISFDSHTGRSLGGLIMDQRISIFLNPFQTNAPGREVVCSVKYISRSPSGLKFGVSFENVGMNAMHTISEYIKGEQTREVMDALKGEADKHGEEADAAQASVAAEAEESASAEARGSENAAAPNAASSVEAAGNAVPMQ